MNTVFYKGKEYRSINALAKELGLSWDGTKSLLDRESKDDLNVRYYKRSFELDGEVYHSVEDLAEVIGCRPTYAGKLISSGYTPYEVRDSYHAYTNNVIRKIMDEFGYRRNSIVYMRDKYNMDDDQLYEYYRCKSIEDSAKDC